MTLVCNIVGARPNFMKMAPVVRELMRRGIAQYLVHTGQHYDFNMSQVFFQELQMPEPDVHLEVGSNTHSRQTADIMVAFEKVCSQRRPDLVVVGGDVNSTLAVALVAAKEGIPVAHVEAGLRSFDRTMPEEINRILTDHLSQYLFTTEASANENLRNEGIGDEKIFFVGNCMVDSLLEHVDVAVKTSPWECFGVQPGDYGVLTLHRPSNVDKPESLRKLMQVLGDISEDVTILFPVHPRTRERFVKWNIDVAPTIKLCEPLPYLTFLGLIAKARCVITDSGGIQEETTVLNVPCLTLRENTERPVTTILGTNQIIGTEPTDISRSMESILTNGHPRVEVPPLWDGKAAGRIVDVIETISP